MSNIKFYIVDTETTGLKASYNEVTEVGVIRYDDRFQLWKQVKCEYPSRANFDALAITNKSMADLSNGDDSLDVINATEKFLNEDGLTPAHRCVVAHNAPFDRRFIHAMWERHDKSFPADLWLDTMSLMRTFVKTAGLGKTSVALHASADLLNIKKLSEAHNAKVDSRNLYLIFKELQARNIDYLPFIKSFKHEVKKDDLYDFDAVTDLE